MDVRVGLLRKLSAEELDAFELWCWRRLLLLGRKAMTNLDCIIKKQRHHFAEKVPFSQGYGLSRSQVWM